MNQTRKFYILKTVAFTMEVKAETEEAALSLAKATPNYEWDRCRETDPMILEQEEIELR